MLALLVLVVAVAVGCVLWFMREAMHNGRMAVRHSRQMIFQMAQVAVPRELFRAILEGIGRLRLSAAASG
jgi:hypothetical protein